MSRDEILVTGTSSATFNPSRRQKINEEKVEKQNKLRPSAEVVLKEIKKDRDMLGELLLALVDPNSNDDEMRVKLAAVRLHRDWINNFESRIKIILKAKPIKKEQE